MVSAAAAVVERRTNSVADLLQLRKKGPLLLLLPRLQVSSALLPGCWVSFTAAAADVTLVAVRY